MDSVAPGKVLFERDAVADAIYLVEEGSVSLCWNTPGHKAGLFEVAGPGAVLGLAECITGERYRMTAQVVEPGQVSTIERPILLALMREYPEFCMQVVRWLSENLHGLYYRFQSAAKADVRRRAPN
jgi:CRP-like cAMP-binding protein